MAKKKTSTTTKKEVKAPSSRFSHKPKNKYVAGTLYVICAVFFTMASFGAAGNIGQFLHNKVVLEIIGYGFIFLPLIFVFLAYKTFRNINIRTRDKIGLTIMFLSLIGLIDIFFSNESINASGNFGKLIGNILISGFDVVFSSVLLVGLFLTFTFIVFDPKLSSLKKIKESLTEKLEYSKEEKDEENTIEEQVEKAIKKEHKESPIEIPAKKEKSMKKKKEGEDDDIVIDPRQVFASSYSIPPLSLLGFSSGKPSTGDIKANANLIQRTLANFGIAVEMDEISIGPTVTRYAMKPAEGVRLSRIASLQNELALALAATSIRIETPIPGRSLVGIEVPNTKKAIIRLGTLLADSEFKNSLNPLLVSLGKGVSGKSFFANIGKMPHALIAGATGSGKSVTLHNIILSLLYRNGPEMLRFIMIDPKRVEMTLYKKIPHLLTPVITDPKKAVLALKWAVREMEKRYDILQKNSVRDIDSYHKTIFAPSHKGLSREDIFEKENELPEKMPYIVIIMDELSDIMSSYPRELEASIVRLAQMSRAVGIHLLLATQRPSVNVITGLIKANIPTRLSLRVASQIDSRTILDSRGAEKLLGNGDMLYQGEGSNELIRIQCPFVSEMEVKNVVEYIQKNYKFKIEDTINLPDEDLKEGLGDVSLADGENEDPLLEEARVIIIESKKASTSYLQRRLSIGYSRAARIIDILEDKGIVGPANGSKPREVFTTSDDYYTDETSYEKDSNNPIINKE